VEAKTGNEKGQVKPQEWEALTPFEREVLESLKELRHIRDCIQDLVRVIEMTKWPKAKAETRIKNERN
jgi:hypothetical protein